MVSFRMMLSMHNGNLQYGAVALIITPDTPGGWEISMRKIVSRIIINLEVLWSQQQRLPQ